MLRDQDFGLGTSGTLAAGNYAEDTNSAHAINGSGQNFGTAVAGVVAIDDGTGGANIWYTTDMSNASTGNSTLIAHTNVDTSTIDNTNVHLAV